MTDAVTPDAPAKEATQSVKEAKVPAAHPPVATMVDEAVSSLKERTGSSLAAIKKHIAANHEVGDVARLAPFIKRYIKSAVTSGKLIQTKGTGASGSFKMAKIEKPKVVKKPAEKKPAAPKKATESKKTAKSPKKTKATPVKKVKMPKKAANLKTPKKIAKSDSAKRPAKAKAEKAAKSKTDKPKAQKRTTKTTKAKAKPAKK